MKQHQKIGYFLYRLVWLLAILVARPASAMDDFPFASPYLETIAHGGHIIGDIVTSLQQDKQGFLWIGTQDGLLRYDGYRFQKFNHEPGNPNSVADNFITALASLPDGKIMIGTRNHGLCEWDPGSGRFRRIQTQAMPTTGISQSSINALLTNAKGDLWVGSDNGIDFKAQRSENFIHLQLHPHATSTADDNVIRTLLLDQQERLWVGSVSGLHRLLPDGKQFERIGVEPGSLLRDEIKSLFQASDGKIWIGTRTHGAAWLGTDDLRIHPLPVDPTRADHLSYGWISSIAQPHPGQIWLGTFGGGINIVSARDGKVLRRLKHASMANHGLAFDTIRSLLFDQTGLLWIGTWGGGLQHYNTRNLAFKLVQHHPSRPDSLSHPDVRTLLELANGQILVGSAGNGIDILDRQHGLVGGYRAKPGSPLALPDANITNLKQTPDGTIWAGTNQAGIVFLRPGASHWESIERFPELQGITLRGMLISRTDKVWIDTSQGLQYWNMARHRFEALKLKINATILSLAEDQQGHIWIGSNAGLWLWNEHSKLLRQFTFDPKRPASLSANKVFGLFLDSKNQLWVETERGLDRLRNNNSPEPEFEHISQMLGLGGKTYGLNLTEDKLGRIWNGNFLLDPQRRQVYPLSQADGMDMGGNWEGSYLQTRDGKLLYGGSKGLVVIEPEQFQPWQPWNHHPPVRVTELKINGKAQPMSLLTPELTLSAKQRNFTLEFAALDYADPQKSRYRYRLQNYDKDWIDTDAGHRSASYGNLWPGTYRLEVQGSNRLGNWSAHELNIPIRVLPAIWQSLWFFGLILLGLGGLGYALYRWRLKRLRLEAIQLKTLIDERTADLIQANSQLASSHTRLANAHRHLQETQSQLIQSEKMAGLGTLTAGIAHEINNPTNFTHVAAQIQRTDIAEFQQFVNDLMEPDAAPEMIAAFEKRFTKLNDNVTTMLYGTERISGIVKNLRAFTRLDEAEKKSVHLVECLNSTLNLVRTSWLEKVEFNTDFSFDPVLECWPALLNQVFMNLLVNGCQAIEEKQRLNQSPTPGKLYLQIRLAEDGTTIDIIFEDNGIGIAPEVQARIMEPFYTTKEVGSGTGLGLSIAFGIVQKHGGKLTFCSTPGQGSRFVVNLPLTRPGDSLASAAPSAPIEAG